MEALKLAKIYFPFTEHDLDFISPTDRESLLTACLDISELEKSLSDNFEAFYRN